MVTDQHRLPHCVVLADTAGRIGEDDRVGAGSNGCPDRVDNSAEIVALVRMRAPEQQQDFCVCDAHRTNGARMAEGGRWGEARQIRHRDFSCHVRTGVTEDVCGIGPPRPEHDGD